MNQSTTNRYQDLPEAPFPSPAPYAGHSATSGSLYSLFPSAAQLNPTAGPSLPAARGPEEQQRVDAASKRLALTSIINDALAMLSDEEEESSGEEKKEEEEYHDIPLAMRAISNHKASSLSRRQRLCTPERKCSPVPRAA